MFLSQQCHPLCFLMKCMPLGMPPTAVFLPG